MLRNLMEMPICRGSCLKLCQTENTFAKNAFDFHCTKAFNEDFKMK